MCREGAWAELTVKVTFMKLFRWAAHGKIMSEINSIFEYLKIPTHTIEKNKGPVSMNQWLLEIMNTYGYLGIAVLIMVENIFPPIPSEVILTFGGFMTTYTNMHIPGVVLSSTAGSLAGAVLLYQLGNLLSVEKIDHLISGPVGRILRLKKKDIQKAADWFDSKGNYTVLLCRFIPIVRSLISIPAGMAKMEPVRFLWMTILGSFLWNLILVSLGAAAGSSWQKAVRYLGNYAQAAKIVLLVFSVTGLLVFLRRQFMQKSSE